MNEENLKLILGLKLRQFRLDRDLSLKELAEKAGVSVSYLNEIEKGKKYPKGDKLIGLADALQVGYDELVSMKLNSSLSPLGELLTTNLLQKLPLEIFGIDSTDLMTFMADTPDKFGSLISTLVEFARLYDVKLEHLYFAAMRSYQEIHHNYFEELEKEAEAIRQRFFEEEISTYSIDDFISVLEKEYGYNIDLKTISEKPELSRYRTIFMPEQKSLLLNNALSDCQKRFSLTKELGYAWLGIKERALTSSWLVVTSFEHVFNNFKSSYVGGALLMPQKRVLKDAKRFFSKTAWEPVLIQEMLDSYRSTPEMLFYRWTQILPTFLGLKQIYFLRFFNDNDENRYHLTKELHFSKLHSPHAVEFNEHYCRRWIAIKILQQIKLQRLDPGNSGKNIIRVQRSNFWSTPNEYLNISISRPLSLRPDTNSSVTIGFSLTDEAKSVIKFWNDAAIQVQNVGETCERCGIENCSVRETQPKILQREQQYKMSEEALSVLGKNYKKKI